MEENIMMNTILKELREFRKENDKRWEANDKRWEENDKRWEANDKKIEQMNARLTRLENARESDKKEFIRIWSIMEQSITEKLSEIERRNDIKFNKIEVILEDHEESIKKQKQKILDNTKKIELQNARIENLEDWKKVLQK